MPGTGDRGETAWDPCPQERNERQLRRGRDQSLEEGGKNPAVPGEWQGLVGAGNERSLMPLQAGMGWG